MSLIALLRERSEQSRASVAPHRPMQVFFGVAIATSSAYRGVPNPSPSSYATTLDDPLVFGRIAP
jgi:hypothetical protein